MLEDLARIKQQIPLRAYLQRRNWAGCRIGSAHRSRKVRIRKERGEAVKMADANRHAAQKHEEEIKGNEDAAAMFKKQAKQAREFADLLRKL